MKHYLLLFLLFLGINNLNAQSSSQNVRGQLTDDISKSPLSGAIIQWIQNGKTELTTTSDSNGYFKLSPIPIGRQEFKITLLGYEEITLRDVLVTAGKEVILTIALAESVKQLEEITIISEKTDQATVNNKYSSGSARSFNIEDTKRYAGSVGDPSRMAANFAGVVAGNDSRNDIVVRGNSPNGMLWQLEGLNIPNPNHYGSLSSTGGPVSMLNNNTLGKSDFFTSAFPSQYGNAVAGVFDLRLRNGNDEKKEFVAQIGFNGLELGAEGPFSKKSKASYLINYRYSTLGVFKALGINFGSGNTVPNYQDLNFKIFIPSGKKGTFTLFGIGGVSDVAFLGNEADTTKNNLFANENENTKARFGTGIFGTSYQRNFSTKTSAKITLGASGTRQLYMLDSISIATRQAFPSAEAKIYTQKYSLVLHLNHKFDRKNSLLTGITSDLTNHDLFNRTLHNGGTEEQILVKVVGEKSLLTQAFTQFKHRFTTNFSANAGLHFQHFSLGNKVVVEPRAGVKYSFGKSQSLGLGYGLHSQTQNPYTYYLQKITANGIEYPNKNIGFTRSHHSVLTYENNITEHFILRAEAYYQYIFQVPVEQQSSSFSTLNTGSSFGFSDKINLVNKGTGKNYGVELTLEHFFHKGFYFLITTSIFDSKYKGSDKVERNTAFNTHYAFNTLIGKEFRTGKKSIIGANIRFSTVGGRYFSPLDVNASATNNYPIYDETNAYSIRQSAYLRLDVKISYKKEFKKSTFETGMDLQNITNHKNIFQQSYNRRTNTIVNQYQQSFFPIPYIRYTF